MFTLMGRFATVIRRARPRPKARVPAFDVAVVGVLDWGFLGIWGWMDGWVGGVLDW